MTPLAEMALSLALEAHAVEAQRVEDVRPVVDVRAILHPKQREFFELDGTLRAALAGRQGGKTFGILAWQFEGMLESTNAFCPYIALTNKSARNIAWGEVVALTHALGIESKYLHEHTLTVGPLPNGSWWQGAGTDDRRTIEAWRGVKTKRPVIEECGSQPPELLGYFVREIIWPTLIRYRGELGLIGTPSPVGRKGDYWHDLTGPGHDPSVPLIENWTAYDNPTLGTFEEIDAFINDFLERNGLTRESPAFLREWMGRWCEDIGALVFPLLRDRNTIDRLPERSLSGGSLPAASWRYVIGVDVGVVDSTAVSVVASHPLDNREFVVRVNKYDGMLPAGLRDKLRALREAYSSAPIVLDTGGMGKVHAEELTRQWSIYVEPAQKTEKRSHVRDIRERLLSGRLLVLDGPDNDDLREEWAVLGWDEKRELPDGVDHASDSVLYALRRLRHYTREGVGPVDDSLAARQKAAEVAMRQRTMARLRPANRERWDR